MAERTMQSGAKRKMNGRILPEKFHILSGSALKTIALVSMLIDHIAALLLVNHPIPLITVFGRHITLYYLMRFVGRLAFPIFACLIAEGYLHTRNRIRYGAVLLAFALLSEIPWDLNFGRAIVDFSTQNVFFTLSLGYLGICAYEGLKKRWFLRAGAIIALLILSMLMHADYGITGFCFILLMYALREHELLRGAIGTGMLSWRAGLAFLPLALYNGKRGFIKGPVLKYAFYLFYPVHLLILYCIRLCLG